MLHLTRETCQIEKQMKVEIKPLCRLQETCISFLFPPYTPLQQIKGK